MKLAFNNDTSVHRIENENNAVGYNTPASDFLMPCAGNRSALRTSPTGLTCFVCSPVSLCESFCLPRSFLELFTVLVLLPCSALPDCSVRWPRLTPVTSIWSLNQVYRFRLGNRSPVVRTLTSPAHLPNLPCRPLVVSGFVVIGQLAQPHSL